MNSYTRHYPTLEELPMAVKILYSMMLMVLGLGYVFAMIQIYEVHSGRDGKPGLSVRDIQIAYSGNPAATRLEGALKGPMASMIADEKKAVIYGWIHSGAEEKMFTEQIAPLIKEHCLMCHDGSNPHVPNLSDYEKVKAVAAIDTGVSVMTLVRVSHIHLFGLAFIFSLLGFVFSHSYVRSLLLKCIALAIPFIAILTDVLSWWLTKVSVTFGYVVMISGALMAASFAFQWFISMYQMWFFTCPSDEVCEP